MANYWSSNSDSAGGPVWDAFKAVVRGSYISRIKCYTSIGRATQEALQKVLDEARSHHMGSPSSKIRGMLTDVHWALQLPMVYLTRKQQLYLSARIHEHGGKNGRLLVYLAHTDFQDNSIAEIQLPDGSTTSDTLTINQTFAEFYCSMRIGLYLQSKPLWVSLNHLTLQHLVPPSNSS